MIILIKITILTRKQRVVLSSGIEVNTPKFFVVKNKLIIFTFFDVFQRKIIGSLFLFVPLRFTTTPFHSSSFCFEIFFFNFQIVLNKMIVIKIRKKK